MAARAIWKGMIELGSIRLPVKLYAAVRERNIHFHLLHDQDLQQLKQRMVNPRTGKTVNARAAKHGYELEPGTFVVLTKGELARLEPEESRALEIERLVPSGRINHQWYDRPYYLGPDQDREEDYFAFVEALKKTGCEAVAHWVMRKKRYVGALRAEGDYLMLITLRHADEVVPASMLDPPSSPPLDARELKLAEQLIGALSDDFDADQYQDDYRQRVLNLIKTKQKGGTVDVPDATEPTTRRRSLADALRASLSSTKG